MRSFLEAGDPQRVTRSDLCPAESRADLPELETGEPETFAAAQVSLTTAVPPDTAVLHVHNGPKVEGVRHLRLAFHLGEDREESLTEDVDQQTVVDLSVASIAERGQWQADYDQLRTWWGTMHRLAGWMRRLAEERPVARLVVWDDTPHQIPWELYYLHHPAAEDKSRWLGAEVEIVRWTSALNHAEGYAAVRTVSVGDLLLMETAELDSVASDLLPPHGPAAVTSMNALMAELRRDDLRFALMMMHGHTENSTDGTEFRFGGITLNQLAHKDMRALAHSQAVVLLNGCNTAKLVPVGKQTPLSTISFAAVFLRKGASSVIATLSFVGADHTHEFVHHLLYPAGEDRRLGSLLRQWRQIYADEAMRHDSANPAHRHVYQDFFHGFMYVCFGHPDSTLQVTGTEVADT